MCAFGSWFSEEQHDYYNSYTEKADDYKKKVILNNHNWININLKEIKKGNIIYINYMTLSQKNIYDYPNECGKVTSIKIDENENVYQINIRNQHKKIINIIKPGCGLYGDGYDMIIQKMQKKTKNLTIRKQLSLIKF